MVGRNSRITRILVAFVAPLAVLDVMAGGANAATGVMKRSEVESKTKVSLTKTVGVAPKSIKCPGDLAAKIGKKMTCRLEAPNGDKLDVFLVVTAVKGTNVKFDIEVGTEITPAK